MQAETGPLLPQWLSTSDIPEQMTGIIEQFHHFGARVLHTDFVPPHFI